ncbi:MAG: glycoside hydrolase family 43 protein [Clostridiaceae bacterium]|nr:glycoside hydrolase family 43 protein [Clostridiaceae bacterium]
MKTIKNPILPGFNPDPCIVRAGDDYYIAVSTFEWFPGVPIYHSRDLIHWELVSHALKTREYLDLTGEEESKGVWAPCLSYCESEKRFYLIYSNVHGSNPWFFDVDNYLIWTDDINGEWSKPVYLNSSGFDPSLFHDGDGRKWLVNKDRDFRPGNMDNRSIVIQEFDPKSCSLTGEPVSISRGATKRGFVEAAHIYKHKGMYYLVTAEGGTGYGHCVAVLRSASVTGPYEPDPANPVITSAAWEFTASEASPYMMPELCNPQAGVQKAGHGSLVETQNGEWYMAHLCGRPILPQRRCYLGRETAIQKMTWTQDGWLRMADGSNLAKAETPAPDLPEHVFEKEAAVNDFDNGHISLQFCSPRNPITPDWADLSSRDGYLRLRGRDSLTSRYDVSVVARRVTSFKAKALTKLEFSPERYHHMAGLTVYYNSNNHYALYKTFDEKLGHCVTAYLYSEHRLTELCKPVAVPEGRPVWFQAYIDGPSLTLSYSIDGEKFTPVGMPFDMTLLADEYAQQMFTGSFVGMFASDLHTKSIWADFDMFSYEDA